MNKISPEINVSSCCVSFKKAFQYKQRKLVKVPTEFKRWLTFEFDTTCRPRDKELVSDPVFHIVIRDDGRVFEGGGHKTQ